MMTCVFVMLSLAGCSSYLKNGEDNVGLASSKYCDMEAVEECDPRVIIYRDKNTNVLYLAVGGYKSFGLTPILNADGTPKLYEE